MAYTTIDNPELYFQTKLYTGNDSTNAQTLDGDENMQVDLVWVKRRSGASGSMLFDNARAAGFIQSDATNAEQDGADYFVSLDSDGFTFEGSDNSNNENNETYVAWCWKESATAGFDIVAFEGNTTARTISHSLSAVPHFIIIKERDNANNWIVYHHKNTSAPETDFVKLEGNDATYDDATAWNDTAPTSSVFSVGAAAMVNRDSMITYLFTSVQGFSKFGSYTGNGNADGTYVHLGFRPAYVMVKRTDSTASWIICDNKRDIDNPIGDGLYANTNEATNSGTRYDFLSNGIKMRSTYSESNVSGATYIYMAFAEAPFVNSNGVPCNAR
jgi:hypothetical protein